MKSVYDVIRRPIVTERSVEGAGEHKYTFEVAREAINCGAWVLMEYENGKIKLGRKPAELGQPQKYISLQKRFKGASAESIEKLGEHLRERYEYLEKLASI